MEPIILSRLVDFEGEPHDVYYNLTRNFKELLLLLTKPDLWLLTVPAGRRGTDTLYNVTFMFHRDVHVPEGNFRIMGTPAAGIMVVHYNPGALDLVDEVLAGEYLPAWLSSTPIEVTLLEDGLQGHVHVEVTDRFEAGSLFYGLLLNPDAFPGSLKGPVMTSVVKTGKSTAEPANDARDMLDFERAEQAALVFKPAKGGCISCFLSVGYVDGQMIPNDAEGKLTAKVKVILSSIAVAAWC